jgi:hypothetical protein
MKKPGSDKQFGEKKQSWEESRRDEYEFARWENEEAAVNRPESQNDYALWERLKEIFPDGDDDDRKPDECKLRNKLIDHAAGLIPLEPQDTQLLKCARANLVDTGRLNISKIARHTGMSRRTIGRRIFVLLSLFLKKRNTVARPRIEAIRLQGERSPRYYMRDECRFGEWTSPFKKPIKKPATPVAVDKGRHEHQSPMYLLLYALVMEFASDRKRPSDWHPEQFAQDWPFNAAKCRKILLQKYGEIPWTARQISSAVCKKHLRCSYCRADILPGFRLNGRRITKGRKGKNHFCDSVCKKRFSRSAA